MPRPHHAAPRALPGGAAEAMHSIAGAKMPRRPRQRSGFPLSRRAKVSRWGAARLSGKEGTPANCRRRAKRAALRGARPRAAAARSDPLAARRLTAASAARSRRPTQGEGHGRGRAEGGARGGNGRRRRGEGGKAEGRGPKASGRGHARPSCRSIGRAAHAAPGARRRTARPVARARRAAHCIGAHRQLPAAGVGGGARARRSPWAPSSRPR